MSGATTPCPTRHAIVLAAGESKRTRPLTLTRPKPLIALLDRPLLAHILDELVGIVERVTLVVGYRADALRQLFGDSYRGMQLEYVLQTQINGTAGALLAVAAAAQAGTIPAIAGPFILLYGDNLISRVDVQGVCQQAYCLAALRVADPRAFGILELDGARVVGILEKPSDPPPDALANPGIYHFGAAALADLPAIQPSPRGEYELTDLIGILAQSHVVGYHLCQGHWIPVGTGWDVLVASQFLLEKQHRSEIHPEAQLADDCHITGAVQIGRAKIGARCRIRGPVWIGDEVVIGDDCTLDRTVLLDGTTIGAGSQIEHSVLGLGVEVGELNTVQWSVLDDVVRLGTHVALRARVFLDIQPVADTAGLLDDTAMQWRGAVLGRGVVVDDGQSVEPGSVLFPPDATP